MNSKIEVFLLTRDKIDYLIDNPQRTVPVVVNVSNVAPTKINLKLNRVIRRQNDYLFQLQTAGEKLGVPLFIGYSTSGWSEIDLRLEYIGTMLDLKKTKARLK